MKRPAPSRRVISPPFSTVRKARRLPDAVERNGWYEILPDPPAATTVSATVQVEWAVIGAGACGLAFARRLGELRPDDSVAVVEASRVGHGTSGRNAGFMLSHHTHGGFANLAAARRSDRLFGLGYRSLRDTVETHQIRCDWNDWGQIYVSASPAGHPFLAAVASGFDGLEVDNEPVSPEALEALTGTPFYAGGVRVAGAALVQPAAMMRGLGATLPTNVRLYEESPVTGIDARGEFRLVCPDGEVHARRLVLANNLFAEEMGAMRHRVVPIATFASLTRPLTDAELGLVGGGAEFGLLPASPNGSTVRLTADRRLLMRNSTSYARAKRFTGETIDAVGRNHRESIHNRWPALDGIEFESTWGGIMAFTRNEGQVFGEIGKDLHIVLTTDAAPMTRGTALGRLLAESLCGIESEELEVARAIPDAALLPPDPILRLLAERRLKEIEQTLPGER